MQTYKKLITLIKLFIFARAVKETISSGSFDSPIHALVTIDCVPPTLELFVVNNKVSGMTKRTAFKSF